MTLGGLPGAHAGFLVLSSCASIVLSCSGLVLLQMGRPSSDKDKRGCLQSVTLGSLAIVGSLFYFSGLVLSGMPFLVGSSGAEGRQSSIIQCLLVGFIGLSEWATGKEFTQKEVILCGLIFGATTLIEISSPRPYDNMTTGFGSQIGGCDGGYRSAFLIYMSTWLSIITFGSLLMVCEDNPFSSICSPERHDEEEEDLPMSYRSTPRTFHAARVGEVRRMALPVIFSAAVSMSGLAFAMGSASNQLGIIFFGAILLVLAVLCAWDWLWRLELPLVIWAALTQGIVSITRTVQTHLAFRDLRWDVAGANVGPLEIQRTVGLPLFVISFGVVIVTVLILYHYLEHLDDAYDLEEIEDEEEENSCGQTLQLVVLAVMIGCLIPGLTLPLYASVVRQPGFVLEGKVQGAGAKTRPPETHNMFSAINQAYTNELPCTALVSIFQFLILPTCMFAGNLILIMRPPWIPQDVYAPLKMQIAHQAPYRFMNPWMIATTMAIAHYSWNEVLTSIGVPEHNELIDNQFGTGAYFMIGFGFASVILSQLLSCEYTPVVYPRGHALQEEEGEDEDFYGMDTTFTSASTSLFLIPVVGVAAYCALTMPFVTLQVRLSGIILKVVHPTLLELYKTLDYVNPTLGWFAMTFGGYVLIFWIVLLLMRIPFAVGVELDFLEFCNIGNMVKRTEQLIRPWVHTHLWALCFFLLFYILTGKNKAIQEVCLQPPPSATGLIGLAILYFGLQTLLNKAKEISPDEFTIRNRKKKRGPNLPGGMPLWYSAIVGSMIFWVVLFYSTGPWQGTLVEDFNDVNNKLEAMLPVFSHKARARIPHSTGDCIARWQSKHRDLDYIDDAAAHKDCSGEHPLTQMNQNAVNVTARWIEGLDTVSFQDLKVVQPASSSHEQLWNLTLTGEFTGLHIWLKVLLGGKTWIDDYMCCQNPFRFALRASALCDEQHGFYSPIKLEVAQLDPFDWKHDSNWEDAMGSHISLSVDYGQKSSVQDSVQKIFVSQIGKFSIRLLDGSELDPLVVAAQTLQAIVQQNSGTKCPHLKGSIV